MLHEEEVIENPPTESDHDEGGVAADPQTTQERKIRRWATIELRNDIWKTTRQQPGMRTSGHTYQVATRYP